MNVRRLIYSVVFGAASLSLCGASFAQTEGEVDVTIGQELEKDGDVKGIASAADTNDALLDPDLYVNIEDAYRNNMALRQPDVKPEDFKTVFFTLWQYQLLQEAKQKFRTRPLGPGDSLDDPAVADRPRGLRELSLGGILFSTGESWIVWLNGQRVTPEAIPKEVIDIKVEKDYIELKWLDAYSNLIYPVRLRPHQRFNLDSRMFLPGTSL